MSRARDVADVQDNLGGVITPFVAGKNKIINGDFGVWQRGTSFSSPANEAYLADRYNIVFDGTATRTLSQQTFSPGTAPVAGYEGAFFLRFDQTTTGTASTYTGINQRIESVRTLAGQTATVSFWAKADATRTLTPNIQQNFGSGGSATVTVGGLTAISLTTSWVRYTQTISIPSISGKTIGTSSFLQLFLGVTPATVQTVDIWGVQLEAGSVATPFTTATGTIQGELAACQRYYTRVLASSGNNYYYYGIGPAKSTTVAKVLVQLPITMRTSPSSTIDYSGLSLYDTVNAATAVTAVTADTPTLNNYSIDITVASGLTQYRPYYLFANNQSGGYLGFSAEL